MRQPEKTISADAIVVLTGGQNRLEAAAGLLAQGKGRRLLVSGVHPDIQKETLRKALADSAAKFDCCVDIDYEAKDTVGNAVETQKWLKKNDFRTFILVTNNYHMPRSLLELGRAAPDAVIIAYPVVNSDLGNGSWMFHPDKLRVLFSEYLKYLGALSRAVLPVPVSIGSMFGRTDLKRG